MMLPVSQLVLIAINVNCATLDVFGFDNLILDVKQTVHWWPGLPHGLWHLIIKLKLECQTAIDIKI